jgi:excisionase family DNA binding protein
MTMATQLKANTTTVPRQRRLPVYVSIGEAAEVMSVSTKTIRRRINDGAIPAYRFGRRNIRIRLEDLEAVSRRLPAVRH